jgi:hypothetical protein
MLEGVAPMPATTPGSDREGATLASTLASPEGSAKGFSAAFGVLVVGVLGVGNSIVSFWMWLLMLKPLLPPANSWGQLSLALFAVNVAGFALSVALALQNHFLLGLVIALSVLPFGYLVLRFLGS